jgi:hypothetical protein
MTSSSMAFRLFHPPHPGYIVILAAAAYNFVSAFFVEVFIDESESAPSDIATEKRGLKATKVTRPIMIILFFLVGAFAVWKMWQP